MTTRGEEVGHSVEVKLSATSDRLLVAPPSLTSRSERRSALEKSSRRTNPSSGSPSNSARDWATVSRTSSLNSVTVRSDTLGLVITITRLRAVQTVAMAPVYRSEGSSVPVTRQATAGPAPHVPHVPHVRRCTGGTAVRCAGDGRGSRCGSGCRGCAGCAGRRRLPAARSAPRCAG